MKIRNILVALLMLSSQVPALNAQGRASGTEVQRYIDSIAVTEPLNTALIGVKAVRVGGGVVADHQSQLMLMPASNLKILTTGVALRELGADFRFETKLAYSGTISDGVLDGDIYIIGGGDPTLGSDDPIAIPRRELFSQWKALISNAGIRGIKGNIIGDGRFFDGAMELSSWLYEDIGTYYGTGMNGLSFYKNVQDFNVSPGAVPGADLKISLGYPRTPWMNFSYDCTTGVEGSGDMLYLYASDLAPVAQLRGTFAAGRAPKTVECSNKFGTYTCAWEFCEYLKANNIQVHGKVADVDARAMLRTMLGQASSGFASSEAELKHIGATYSPRLSDIVFLTNQNSDNFYAETLFRMVGKQLGGSADYGRSSLAVTEAMRELGADLSKGVSIVDGSGLSRKNLVSPQFLCDFLRAMLESSVCEAFVETLTQPGKGSQIGRMRAENPSFAERVYYKSGSMEGVRCYSGYVVPADGGKEDIIVFSILVNNYTGPSWRIMNQIDRILALIAKEN